MGLKNQLEIRQQSPSLSLAQAATLHVIIMPPSSQKPGGFLTDNQTVVLHLKLPVLIIMLLYKEKGCVTRDTLEAN